MRKGLLAVIIAAVVVAAAVLPVATVAAGPASGRSAADLGPRRASGAFNLAMADAIASGRSARTLALAIELRATGLQATNEGASLARHFDDPKIVAWREAAERKAGMDPVANAMLAAIAAGAGDPPAQRQAAARWANAEPDNIASLFFAGAPAAEVLHAARTRHRFDAHWFEQIHWASEEIGHHPQLVAERDLLRAGRRSPQAFADGLAFQMVSLHGMPSFQDVALACRGAALSAEPERRADCVALGHTLRDTADFAVAQVIGNALVRSATTDPAALAEVERFGRRIRWQMEQQARLFGSAPDKESEHLHRTLSDPKVHTEQQSFERALAEAGIALEPPADWKPAR